jgi:hypothetical protein
VSESNAGSSRAGPSVNSRPRPTVVRSWGDNVSSNLLRLIRVAWAIKAENHYNFGGARHDLQMWVFHRCCIDLPAISGLRCKQWLTPLLGCGLLLRCSLWRSHGNRRSVQPQFVHSRPKTLPFSTRLRVTDPTTARTVEVTVNDRGPFEAGAGNRPFAPRSKEAALD